MEAPRALTAPETYKYRYSVDVPPPEVKDESLYSHDYQSQVPRKDRVYVGGSYDYKLEVPPAPKEEPKYSFKYDLHVPKPEPQPKT